MSDHDHDDLDSISVHSAASSAHTHKTNDDDGVSELNLDSRDPNKINEHIETCFDDVIAEPDGAHSADCVWKNAFRCFGSGKGLCYKILTFVCSIPLAFCWGCQFACVTFTHIWFVTPCFRIFDINFDCFRKFWATCIHCMYDPCCEAYALIFSKIYVTHVAGSGAEEKGTVFERMSLRRASRRSSLRSSRRSGKSNNGFIRD